MSTVLQDKYYTSTKRTNMQNKNQDEAKDEAKLQVMFYIIIFKLVV